MKPIQLVIGAVALAAAGGAGYIMLNLNQQQPAQIVEAEKVPSKKVLAATKEIPMGNKLTPSNFGWVEWPTKGIKKGFITQDENREALKDFNKTIARLTFYEGEPIREEKIVRSDSGYMSAILPSGKRAVAVRIAAVSGAGGFILPNDYVDVVTAETGKGVVGGRTVKASVSETLLKNIRVLAIDQVIEDKNGRKAKIGKTATLELTPGQVEILTVAQQKGGTLTLALRSVEDSGPKGDAADAKRKDEESKAVRIIRYGAAVVVKQVK